MMFVSTAHAYPPHPSPPPPPSPLQFCWREGGGISATSLCCSCVPIPSVQDMLFLHECAVVRYGTTIAIIVSVICHTILQAQN